ncbi:MAG: hypothetical protein KJO82_09330 [Gammaproteobacteria bacterium]|nr:hypothetical protein [Gammaproteobacteria bacterium]NNC78411.1 hypothetical protein [Woeseiaceae bacterium]
MRNARILLAALMALLVCQAATGKSLVTEFKGNATTTTSDFVVEGPWLLDWRLDGDYDQLVALDISLIESKTGKHIGRVLHTKYKGNGLKLFNEGGKYKLRISSTFARWRVRIQQISPEEVEQYTPRKKERSLFQ